MDVSQFRVEIIRPTTKALGMWSPASESQLLGTAVHESGGLRYIRQLEGGPALSFYGIEPRTHDDLFENFLRYRPDLYRAVLRLTDAAAPSKDALLHDMRYATAIARLIYFRDKLPIPEDLEGQAAYWKRVWNTVEGRGTEAQYLENWRRYVNKDA